MQPAAPRAIPAPEEATSRGGLIGSGPKVIVAGVLMPAEVAGVELVEAVEVIAMPVVEFMRVMMDVGLIRTAELSERLASGPVRFRVVVQLAQDGDDVTDATVVWPEDRELVEFGALALTERVDDLVPERRKVIFDPIPRVEGIDSAGDPLTEVRSEVYLLSVRRRRAAAAS